ncbi:MAG: inositol monophosphatase [Roseobacter sp.]
MSEQDRRLAAAVDIARTAGQAALAFFRDIDGLDISQKGTQDWVSNADLEVETLVRAEISKRFAEDGIVGEEHAPVASSSGWTWVIDPIDGTANFVVGLPQWCVILACVREDATRVGVIYDPCADEMFCAAEGQGARLNDRPVAVAKADALNAGRVGLGMSGRPPVQGTPRLLSAVVEQDGRLFHNASGGLMLAYTAAGRLIAFAEPHMNAWDCLAGQLMVREAGGRTEQQSADAMLVQGGRVIVAAPAVFDRLLAMADDAYKE